MPPGDAGLVAAALHAMGYSPSTVTQYAEGARRWLAWLDGRAPTTDGLEAWRAHLTCTVGLAPSTADRLTRGARSALAVLAGTGTLRGPNGRADDPHARARAIAAEYLQDGETLATVGARYGITRERVRQLVAQVAPRAAGAKRGQAAARRAAELSAGQAGEAPEPCEVCGTCVTRPNATTCTPACRTVFNALRRLVDADYWAAGRRTLAASAVRNGHGASWAHRALRDPTDAPGSRWVQPGSTTWHAVAAAVGNRWPIAARIPEWAVEAVIVSEDRQ